MHPDTRNPQIHIVPNTRCELGENPLWHPQQQHLYWTDIDAGRLYCLDPATDRPQCIYQDRPVGGFTLQAGGALLLFRDHGNVVKWRHGQIERTVIDHLPEETGNRFNDVCADPQGRVFCGTLSTPERKGRLYRLDSDGSLHIAIPEIGTPNGMGFTPDHKHMYVTDTRAHTIWRYEYDAASGEITNPSTFFTSPEPPARPDGMAVDSEGCVWTALWEGGKIVRLSPQGELLAQYKLPTRFVSNLAFGGTELADIYITTARGDLRPASDPPAGALFRLAVNAAGVLPFNSRIQTRPG